MKKWRNGAKKRLTQIQAAEDAAKDMRTIAAGFGDSKNNNDNAPASTGNTYGNGLLLGH